MIRAAPTATRVRRLPVGAEPGPDGTHFRVWAPGRTVAVEILPARVGAGADVHPLEPERDGYHAALLPGAGPGTRYRFRLDDGRAYPDPASRWQPEGPHGPSVVVDPDAWRWTDDGWQGPPRGRTPVLYEMHPGTFTPKGTWAAAAERLPHLRELGVDAIQMMPVADFPGDYGWGYDGVLLFAPYHRYGTPDDLRVFVDRAHAHGIAVILDVVYNHLGPDGNYLWAFSRDYFSRTHKTDWGDTPNFDGPRSAEVRAFFLANVRHWIREYHFDGFRFDATQDLHDTGPDHILAALSREARRSAGERRVLLVAENEPQDTRLVRAPEQGGHGLDMLGNDDFHHSAVVALTGRRQAYYRNHRGTAQELVSALKHGFLYQGQWYAWQDKRRGTSTREIPPGAFLHYLENHDQVANSLHGTRLHRMTSPGRWRAMVAVQLLGPQTPFLFQGQEFASSAPFLYFADQLPELARATRRGRARQLAEFESLGTEEARANLPDPASVETFRRCRLDWSERERNAWAFRLHRDLLALRSRDPVFSGAVPTAIDGAVLGEEAFVLRWWSPDGRPALERLMLVNLGRDLRLVHAPEPLLAPPPGGRWRLAWSSEAPQYGGNGTPPVETESWNLPSASAVVLLPAGPPGGSP